MQMLNNHDVGEIVKISGPVVGAVGLKAVRLHDVVYVGKRKLIGEIIRLSTDLITIQVYEETSGVRLGEPVYKTGTPLIARLGPGLLGQVFDGLQRPLNFLAEEQGYFLSRGVVNKHLEEQKRWYFKSRLSGGSLVNSGDILGYVQEKQGFTHNVLVPPNISGEIMSLDSGLYNVNDQIGLIKTRDGRSEALKLSHQWPVRIPRPVKKRLNIHKPLVTGTRIIDLLFPVARGGTAIIPGGFGTGKTVTQQSLSRWADVDVVVYVGCGERGNEMAEVLAEFPKLEDPKTGLSLMDRTILIANTSNMPVAAREASIYTGMTLAEYYRDMGYHVLMLADSTSRWAEALREISSRLEEIPGEEGYPAYMAARLSAFYERTGEVQCSSTLHSASSEVTGSVTLVGAVSPPGSDFSEPITQNSMRITGTFWALDYELSRRRHFPAINWHQSYTLYNFDEWYKTEVHPEYPELIKEIKQLLRKENELMEIVHLIGKESLSDSDLLVLFSSKMLREDLLQQMAFHPIDGFCPLEKAYWMGRIIMCFYRLAFNAVVSSIPLESITSLPEVVGISRMRDTANDSFLEELNILEKNIESKFDYLMKSVPEKWGRND
jgi:V/A-type H+-transporting ATPase subunit A